MSVKTDIPALYEEAVVNLHSGVAVVTLNRPDKLNAYTPDMGEDLVAIFRSLFVDDEVKAIILTGAGRGFCAGADRAYFGGKRGRCGKRLGQETFLSSFAGELSASGKPMMVAVNGSASGIGVTMTLPFDLRIASTEASFDFPFVKLGVVPAFGSSYFLPQLVGRSQARDLLLNNRHLNAEEALAMGLVNRVVDPDELLPYALAMAKQWLEAPDGIVSLCKGMQDRSVAETLAQHMQSESEAVRHMAEKKRQGLKP